MKNALGEVFLRERAWKKSLSALAICLALFSSSFVFAQDTSLSEVPLSNSGLQNEPVTLEDAVRRAVSWHPSIDQAIADLSISEQAIREAKASYYPQISGGMGPSLTFVDGVRWLPRATLSGSQMIHDFGKARSSVDIARAGERVSKADVLLAVDNLARNVSTAVIEIQRGFALLKVAEDQLIAMSDINKLVQLRVQSGASPKSDAAQAEARIQSAQAIIQQTMAELLRWQSNLRFMLGREYTVEVVSEMPDWQSRSCQLPEPDWTQLPGFQRAEAKQDEAAARYRAARASMLPTLSLASEVDTDIRRPLSERNDVSVGFTVSSSLYQGGMRKAQEQAAFYAMQAADAAMQATLLESNRALAENREQIDRLQHRVTVLQERRDSQDQVGMLYRLQYFEMGTRTLIDLLNSQLELHQIRFDLVNADHDLRRLNTECLHASGKTRDEFSLTGMTVRGVTL